MLAEKLPNSNAKQRTIGRAGDPGWPARILCLAPQMLSVPSRTGIQRVVIECTKAMMPLVPLDFVKWDSIDGQLRYFNARDFEHFFRSRSVPKGVRINPFAERRRYRFEETIIESEKENVWLLMPEIPYHLPAGTQIYSRIVSQARNYGVRTAAVFYDLIPITNSDYQTGGVHERYVRELLGVDLILPISHYSADELTKYFRRELGVSDEDRRTIHQVVTPVPLADQNSEIEVSRNLVDPKDRNRNLIVLLGTVEPRKQQVEVLHAFRQRAIAEKHGLQTVVVGSLHPLVAEKFRGIVANDPTIEYLGYADEKKIDEIFARARFSVFASNDEGFGLPICESLARGVPCLAADFGAMAEVGQGGGCLLVDVNDPMALADGIERLSKDDELVSTLVEQLNARRFRTWTDYAGDVLEAMTEYAADSLDAESFSAHVRLIIGAFRSRSEARSVAIGLFDLTVSGEKWKFLLCRGAPASDISRTLRGISDRKGSKLAVALLDDSVDLGAIDDSAADLLFSSDAWIIESQGVYDRLIERAAAREFRGVLPTRCCVGDDEGRLEDKASAELANLAAANLVRRRNANRERIQRHAGDTTVGISPQGCRLNIIITTFNRGPFVEENVRWILSHITAFGEQIMLTVVDNASTDDTMDRLGKYVGSQNFELIRNAGNVGMLGNLQVCSAIASARHAWFIGDDDFIVPSVLPAILEAVSKEPYLPFIFINFGVYHRAEWVAGDEARTLIQNPILLAPHPSPTGEYCVKDIAIEHDNLFTAIYPIVFRTDHAAACFNYPFTGKPFSSLIESIPTTKYILERCADVEALWISDVGIVGNAHNSWQRYRVRWHSVIMAKSFELAREAGVSSATLYGWSKLHRQLFAEAEQLFPTEKLKNIFSPRELETTHRVFREHLQP